MSTVRRHTCLRVILIALPHDNALRTTVASIVYSSVVISCRPTTQQHCDMDTPFSMPYQTAPWRILATKKDRERLGSSFNITPCLELNWIYITIRRSGRRLLNIQSQPTEKTHTLVLSSLGSDNSALRAFLWDEFEFMMSEIESRRERIKSENRSKGELRMTAPIPWLAWISSCGRQGQTRNKANFYKIWEDCVEPCLRTGSGRCQVTSILLPSDASLASIASDPLTITYDEATCSRPRCDSGVSFGTSSEPGKASMG